MKYPSVYSDIIEKLNRNQHYNAGFSCDYERNTFNCHCPDYCRCAVITDFKPTKFDATEFINNLIFDQYGRELSMMDAYACDRVIRASKLTKGSFEGGGVGGYYGEELLVEINREQLEFIAKNLYAVEFLQSNIDKIKYLLELEYGYLLDTIKNATSAEFITIDKSQIIQSQEDYRKKVEVSEFYSQEYHLPTAIVNEVSPNHYRILDGYHRTFSNSKLENIDVVVIK